MATEHVARRRVVPVQKAPAAAPSAQVRPATPAGRDARHRGRRTANVVPRSALDSTRIVPPWARTIWLTMKRPSPSPRALEESRSADPRQKGSKITSISSGAIAGPSFFE